MELLFWTHKVLVAKKGSWTKDESCCKQSNKRNFFFSVFAKGAQTFPTIRFVPGFLIFALINGVAISIRREHAKTLKCLKALVDLPSIRERKQVLVAWHSPPRIRNKEVHWT